MNPIRKFICRILDVKEKEVNGRNIIYSVLGIKTQKDKEMLWSWLTKTPTRRKPNEKFGNEDRQL